MQENEDLNSAAFCVPKEAAETSATSGKSFLSQQLANNSEGKMLNDTGNPPAKYQISKSQIFPEITTSRKKYVRFPSISTKQIGNKKLRHRLSLQQKLNEEAIRRLAVSEILLPSSEGFLETEGFEKSYCLTQADILSNLDVGSSKKIFDLQLSYGPYCVDFSKNGRYLLFGGKNGNFSMLDCHNYNATDVNVQETVRAVKFLHDHSMFAVAQKKYVYIYDHSGLELHCMRDNMLSYCLDFLPFHFLLASIGEFGELSYDDVSMGQVIAKHKTQRGPCHCMRQNSSNAVIHLGHSRGTVTLWTPNLSKPAVDLLCHKGPVTCLDMFQNYMATAGMDGFWKVWDMRTYKCLHTFNYFGAPPSSIDVSQTGLIGIGFGPHVQIWKDVFSIDKPKMPYLTQDYFAEHVKSVRFRPFEDICCVGRSDGISAIVVPGSGMANYDSFAADPFETPKYPFLLFHGKDCTFPSIRNIVFISSEMTG
ncbi:BING4CT (NUC141) domain-containing protein [Cardiosporidium cionae]|uniref:BING4CT (NUC141) domain-containing protein n=1 Tax=Cardiosporidium cionae TaxID=476202 RepID=A0ABQ7J4U0_9APIC|nr:BING4CT (NUC141) domain-containing protein [Cardiosporidium cionae]|eukprot:KAF8818753.1 BING4CT (NUC141) domain-containing protein [Cardiosporidium cionae]